MEKGTPATTPQVGSALMGVRQVGAQDFNELWEFASKIPAPKSVQHRLNIIVCLYKTHPQALGCSPKARGCALDKRNFEFETILYRFGGHMF